MTNLEQIILMIVSITATIVVSAILAVAGEPRSVWLMCKIFKMCELSI